MHQPPIKFEVRIGDTLSVSALIGRVTLTFDLYRPRTWCALHIAGWQWKPGFTDKTREREEATK